MTTKELKVRVKHAYLSATEWVNKNPILQAGELGFESNTRKYKIGDGVTKWSNLPYVSGADSDSDITVDTALSNTSTNPVQNKVIKDAFDELALPSGMLTTPTSHRSFIGKIATDALTSINNITQMTIEQSADGVTWETVFDSDTTTETNKLAYSNGLELSSWIHITKGYMARVTFATHTNTYFSSLAFYIKSINDTDSTGSSYKCYYGYNNILSTVRASAKIHTWGSWVNTIFKVTGYNIIQYVFNEDKKSDVTLAFAGALCKSTYPYRNVLNFDANKKSTITSFPVKAPNFIGKFNGFTIETSVPANAKFTDTVYTHPSTHPASMITGLSTVATSGSYNDLTNKPTIPSAYTLPNATSSTLGGVKIGNNISVTDGTISITKSNVTSALGYTPPTSDTVYDNATTTTAGLMSASDKAKLNNIADNANNYIHPPTHPASMITGLANVATSGSYNDLKNKPTIPTKVSQLTNDSGYLTQHQSLAGYVKSVNNITPNSDGNVTIPIGGGSSVTVDTELSATSTNPVQNKVINAALSNKADNSVLSTYLPLTGGTVTGSITASNFQTGTGATNYFQCRKFRGEGDSTSYYHAIDFGYSAVDFYEYDANWNFYQCTTGTKAGAVLVGNINSNGWNGGARLTGAPTAPTAATGTSTTQIATTAFVQNSLGSYVKTVNNTAPDENGNVTITTSGGGGSGVSLSTENTWTAKQNFQKMKFNFESYSAPRISGATDNPSSSVAVYNVQGNFTLNMSTLAGLLSNGDATVFTAYITSNGAYTLSINNAGTLKYVGSASDLAITANGLLLNIMLIKSSSGVVSSVVQASKLA